MLVRSPLFPLLILCADEVVAEWNGQDRRDLLKALGEMNARNAAAGKYHIPRRAILSPVLVRSVNWKYIDLSRQPVAEVPATSSSAWSPLLNSQLNIMQPTVDQWRGTLDTLLIFVSGCIADRVQWASLIIHVR